MEVKTGIRREHTWRFQAKLHQGRGNFVFIGKMINHNSTLVNTLCFSVPIPKLEILLQS